MNIDIKADTDQARRIGGYSKDKKRPIHVKLTKESTKLAILQIAKKLKGSDIWIDQDYTKETQEERRRLIPHLKEARKKGFKAQLKFNMLIVNDQIYKWKYFLIHCIPKNAFLQTGQKSVLCNFCFIGIKTFLKLARYFHKCILHYARIAINLLKKNEQFKFKETQKTVWFIRKNKKLEAPVMEIFKQGTETDNTESTLCSLRTVNTATYISSGPGAFPVLANSNAFTISSLVISKPSLLLML
ncbi:hypothetical protein RN001_009359 [Aquatica leii]|uniref:Uncharacterized protein n=1 Tax=Aquatica leii TaxID=1421715 RepID=A0AAN7SMW6_9COLE|nr:hypothetical protein RN001_009359 [Aquatica leii]